MFIAHLVNRVVGSLVSASSRQFERGSKPGAITGLFLGIGAGLALAVFPPFADTADYTIPRIIIFGIVLGFIGALLGSRFGRQPTFSDGVIDAQLLGAKRVRISRLNNGLVPFVFFLGLLAALIVTIYEGLRHQGNRESLWIVVAMLGFATAVALLAAGCSILWFDAGPMGFRIFRLFRRTTYPFAEIEVCGFELNQKLWLNPRVYSNVFTLCFRDGHKVTLNVPPDKAVPLAKVFIDHGVRDQRPNET